MNQHYRRIVCWLFIAIFAISFAACSRKETVQDTAPETTASETTAQTTIAAETPAAFVGTWKPVKAVNASGDVPDSVLKQLKTSIFFELKADGSGTLTSVAEEQNFRWYTDGDTFFIQDAQDIYELDINGAQLIWEIDNIIIVFVRTPVSA